MSGHIKLWTREELNKALALREYGLSWATIASRLGRTEKSIASAVAKYKAGKLPFKWLDKGAAQ